MWDPVGIVSTFFNMGIATGFVLGALALLRPVLFRLLSPQQRVVLWTAVWLTAYLPSWYGLAGALSFLLPVGFRGWITPRTGAHGVPAYLPVAWDNTAANLVFPGGKAVELHSFYPVLYLLGIYVAGIVAACWYTGRQNKALLTQAGKGRILTQDDCLEGLLGLRDSDVCVHICPDLGTSFLTGKNKTSDLRYNVYLQQELPREGMALVLLHEMGHIRLHHLFCKTAAGAACCLHWWNPLVWLGFRYFCQDLELACDRWVLAQLDRQQRADYAQILLDLAGGRPLLDAPLAFGESDAALRIRQAVGWKQAGLLRTGLTWAAAVVLLLFFTVAPAQVPFQADKDLAWKSYLQEISSLPEGSSLLQEEEARMQESGILSPCQELTGGWYRVEPVTSPGNEAREVTLWFSRSDGRWVSTYYWWWGIDDLYGSYRFFPSGSFRESAAPDLAGFTPLP